VVPNTAINVMRGEPYLSIGPIVPTGPERTWRSLDYFLAPDADPAWVTDFLELDDQVGREDRTLVERVQRGVRAGAIEHGFALPRSEQLVVHFERLLVDSVGK
jgi:choline monooxygenase